jgi:hypothetical protein
MTEQDVIESGTHVGNLKVRHFYQHGDAFASCEDGGLRACFEDYDEMESAVEAMAIGGTLNTGVEEGVIATLNIRSFSESKEQIVDLDGTKYEFVVMFDVDASGYVFQQAIFELDPTGNEVAERVFVREENTVSGWTSLPSIEDDVIDKLMELDEINVKGDYVSAREYAQAVYVHVAPQGAER